MAATAASGHRSLVRDIALAAAATTREADRISKLEQDLRSAYSTAAVLSGSYQNSGIEEMTARAANRAAQALPVRKNAEPFLSETAIRDAPSEELDRLLVRLAGDAQRLQATREDLESELADLRRRNEAELSRRLPPAR